MDNSYVITVNNTSKFKVALPEILALDAVQKDKKFHILQNNISFHAEITECNFNKKTYTILVNNNYYKCSIENNLDQLIKSLGFEISTSRQVKEIKAPMPGLVLDVLVSVGNHVTIDTPLLILEAMKMENTILSPRDGVIKSVICSKGTTVDKGALLIEFEE